MAQTTSDVPRWVDHGTILIPVTVLNDALEAIGEGEKEITEADRQFQRWAEWLEASGQPRPSA